MSDVLKHVSKVCEADNTEDYRVARVCSARGVICDRPIPHLRPDNNAQLRLAKGRRFFRLPCSTQGIERNGRQMGRQKTRGVSPHYIVSAPHATAHCLIATPSAPPGSPAEATVTSYSAALDSTRPLGSNIAILRSARRAYTVTLAGAILFLLLTPF